MTLLRVSPSCGGSQCGPPAGGGGWAFIRGSLTLLVAERDRSLRAAINFASAAGSWEGSADLRARLIAAVGRLTAPAFFVYAANDFSVAPGKVLDAEMTRRSKAHRLKVFSAFGQTLRRSLVHLSRHNELGTRCVCFPGQVHEASSAGN